MATNQDLINKILGKSTKTLSSTQKQTESLRKRLTGAGVDVEKAEDKRNIIEKALNLTPDQNVLFDIFEILGRPQQAVFGGVDALQSGTSFGRGALQGLTGDKFTRGKDIINSESDAVRKVTGFGLDIFADPLDLAFIAAAPATGGTSLAGLALNAKDIGKASDAARTAIKANDFRKATDIADKLVKKGGGSLNDLPFSKSVVINDIVKTGSKPVNKKSVNDIIFGKAFQGIKAGSKYGAKGLGNSYRKAFGDEAFEKAARNIKGIKTSINDSINVLGGLSKKTKSARKGIEGNTNLISKQAKITMESIDDDVILALGSKIGREDDAQKLIARRNSANKKNLSGAKNKVTKDIQKFKDEITESLGANVEEQLLNMREYVDSKGNRIFHEITGEEFVKDFGRFPMNEETTSLVRELERIMGTKLFQRSPAVKGESRFYTMFKNARKDILADENAKEFLAQTMRMPSLRTNTQIKELEALLDDPDFMVLFNKIGAKLDSMIASLKKVDPNLSKSFLENSGYVRHKVIGDTARGVNRQGFLKQSVGEDMFNKLRANTDGSFEQMISKLRDPDSEFYDPALAQSIIDEVDKLDAIRRTPEIRDDELLYRGNEKTVQRRKYRTSVQETNNIIDIYSLSAVRESKKARKALEELSGVSEELSEGLQAFQDLRVGISKKVGEDSKKSLVKLKKADEKKLKRELFKEDVVAFSEDSSKMFVDEGSLKNKPEGLNAFLNGNVKDMNIKEIKEGLLKYGKEVGVDVQIGKFKSTLSKIAKEKGKVRSGAFEEFLSSKEGRKLFEDNLIAAMDDWVDKVPRLTKESAMIDNLLIKSSFEEGQGRLQVLDAKGNPVLDELGNPQYRAFGIMDNYIDNPIGTRALSSDKELPRLKNKLIEISRRTDNPAMDDLIKSMEGIKKGQKFVVDNRVLDMISFMSRREGVSSLLKVVDSFTNLFKRTKLLSPGFQVRNILGNATNMALGGMPPGQIIKHYSQADNILKKAPELMKKRISGEVLSVAEAGIVKNYEDFMSLGFNNINRDLYGITDDMVDTSMKKTGRTRDKIKANFNKINQMNATLNEATDLRFRMGYHLYMKKNPKKFMSLGVDNAADATRKVMFDPNDLTDIERNRFRRVVPFYTFTKKNLAFQMENFTKNTSRYVKLRKMQRAMWEDVAGIEEEDLREYQLENFWIPTFFKDSEGNNIAIKSNLPVSDLGEFLSDPLRKSLGSTNALVRAPFEIATGNQIFTGQSIERFEDERARTLNTGIIEGLPSAGLLGRKGEFALENIGVDVPIKTGAGIINSISGLVQGKGLADSFAGRNTIGGSFLTSIDVEKNRQSKEFERLNRTQDLIKLYKQKGVEVPTIRELERSNTSRYEELLRKIKGSS